MVISGDGKTKAFSKPRFQQIKTILPEREIKSENLVEGENMDKTSELIKIAQNLASDTLEFHSIKGPGKGDHATKIFMKTIQKLAQDAFGQDYSEKKISGKTNFAVDFWFPDEMTIV